jgi:hypothetical protein
VARLSLITSDLKMAELQTLVDALSHLNHPPIIVEQLVRFLALSSCLKNEILLVQPSSFEMTGNTYPLLSPSIQEFLADTTNIPRQSINVVWGVLARAAFRIDLDITPANSADSKLQEIYLKQGLSRGICKSSAPLRYKVSGTCTDGYHYNL